MRELFDLGGKTAIVTGSSRGIGRAIAMAFADFGAQVVISSRKLEACREVVAEIRARGGTAEALTCNVTEKSQIQNLVACTHRAFGKVDILVCNAAVNPHFGPSLEIPDEAFQKVMQCNVHSNLWLAQAVAPEMKVRRDGAIILISSIGGFLGTPVLGAYAISKAADMQMARNLASELGPFNIRVNCIAPGLVRTDFARALWEDDARRSKRESQTPMRRLGEPEDIAGAAVYLASRAGAWTCGQTLTVDGGYTIDNS